SSVQAGCGVCQCQTPGRSSRMRRNATRHRSRSTAHSKFAMTSTVARISYNEETAAAFKAVREVPREGLVEWREAIRRHLRPSKGMTLVDIGAGTGAFASAFSEWFELSVLAVEPSAAMRERIPRTPAIQVFEGDATALP